jgi:hypothetical protein
MSLGFISLSNSCFFSTNSSSSNIFSYLSATINSITFRYTTLNSIISIQDSMNNIIDPSLYNLNNINKTLTINGLQQYNEYSFTVNTDIKPYNITGKTLIDGINVSLTSNRIMVTLPSNVTSVSSVKQSTTNYSFTITGTPKVLSITGLTSNTPYNFRLELNTGIWYLREYKTNPKIFVNDIEFNSFTSNSNYPYIITVTTNNTKIKCEKQIVADVLVVGGGGGGG